MQGVTYGPFEPVKEGGDHLPDPARVASDMSMMRQAGINLLRLYHQPPRWFLDLAQEHEVRVMTTVPWPLRGLFLDDRGTQNTILSNMRDCARSSAAHPAMFGFFVDNEMAPDLVRWHGRKRIQNFLNSCIQEIKNIDSEALVSYAGFPPSESVLPESVDFVSFNVYLHRRLDFQKYLARLHNIAGEKPLVFSEFGMDTIRHGEEEQAALITEHVEDAARGGAAGTIVFSWTDEWFTGGAAITDWAFGLVDAQRRPKQSYQKVSAINRLGSGVAHRFPITPAPKVSVVVCSYNGAPTLEGCLRALKKQSYPDFEIVVVDDGSRDNTQEILSQFPEVRNIRQENMGLSVARNTGIDAAEGDVVAFTDSDCMPDEDWLYYLMRVLLEEGTAAVGGPNISPPAHQWVQAAVAAAPGSPSHILFDDRRAEHVPGCNMAFWKWALRAVGGFDPVYRKAGDDVDVCWKLLDRGWEIAFSPSAVVWHHRRFNVKTYFSQQKGYGEAEALLRFRHLNRFDDSGIARWKGRIYGGLSCEALFYHPIIYYGQYAMGQFQSIYTRPRGGWLGLFGSLQWVGSTVFMLALSYGFPALRVIPLLMFAGTVTAALVQMASARLEMRFDGFKARILLFYLALTQPLARAWARYFTWLEKKRTPLGVELSKETLPHHRPALLRSGLLEVWSQEGKSREVFLPSVVSLLSKEGWMFVLDNGWSDWDVQIFANRWWHVRIRTQSEAHAHGACLTRIGVLLVVTSFSVLAWIVLAGVTVSLWMADTFQWWATLPLLLLMGYWLFSGLRARRRVAETILAATRREGMRRLEAIRAEQK